MISYQYKVLFLCTFLFVLFLVSGCSQDSTVSKRSSPDHLVEVAEVKLESIAIERQRTGSLQSNQDVDIYNQEEGQIIELPYFEGDTVTKGDVLVRLDDRLIMSQLARTQALRKKAALDLKRMSRLANKQMMAEADMTRVETELAVAKSDEETLKTRLEYATIVAPITGVISQRLSEPGNIAQRYTHLLTISDLSSLTTEVTVSDLLINKLSVGAELDIQIDALLRSEPIKGKIKRIHPNLDPLTRTGIVEISLNPVPEGARPGQLARVTLRSDPAERLLIPYSGLRRSSAGEYVFVIDDQLVAKEVSVVSGLRINGQVEILKGLNAGENVVTRGFTNLQENKKVKIVGQVVSTPTATEQTNTSSSNRN